MSKNFIITFRSELGRIQREIKETTNYSFIYADPSKFVRVFNPSQRNGVAVYPAHIVTKEDAEVPLRLVDSGMEIISSKNVSPPKTL